MQSSRLGSTLVSICLVVLTLGKDAHLEELGTEEACAVDGSGEGEACALSLRQLRVRGVAGATATTPASAMGSPAVAAQGPAVQAAPSPSAAVDVGGLPGGWGEAAEFAGQNATLRAQWSDFDDDGWSGGGLGSCAQYGCIHYYAPWHLCQCNTACARHGSCCDDYSGYCGGGSQPTGFLPPAPAPAPSHGRKVMTLYHQTDQHAANLIIQNGFRPGKSGWCGGAIYFATSPAETYTKAIGADSHKGAMLQAQVDVGRVLHENRKCGSKQHDEAELARLGYDSISFNPGDGDEYVIYDKHKVLSIKQIPL